MKAKEFIPAGKPRNFVAKNAPTTGAGRHKDSNKKKDQEQGKVKHKQKQFAEDTAEAFSQAAADAKKIRDKKRGIVGHGLPWKDYTDMNELSVDVAEFVIKKGGSKWLDLKKSESVYKMIENIFVKYGYPTKIFKPVAKIVFDTLGNDYWGLKFDTTSVVKKRVFPRLDTSKQATENIAEKAPPGFKGTVKAMKKHKDIDNPFALAWSMKNKGFKSHKKADGSDK